AFRSAIRNRASRYSARGLAYAMLAPLALLFLFPFYWLFISAFKDPGQIFSTPPRWIPTQWQWSNFRDVLQLANVAVVRASINSMVVALGHCGLVLFLCSLAGYAFAKYPGAPGRNKLFIFVLGTMMIPGSVLIIPLYVIMVKLHAINTYWAMILPGAANAFGI